MNTKQKSALLMILVFSSALFLTVLAQTTQNTTISLTFSPTVSYTAEAIFPPRIMNTFSPSSSYTAYSINPIKPSTTFSPTASYVAYVIPPVKPSAYFTAWSTYTSYVEYTFTDYLNYPRVLRTTILKRLFNITDLVPRAPYGRIKFFVRPLNGRLYFVYNITHRPYKIKVVVPPDVNLTYTIQDGLIVFNGTNVPDMDIPIEIVDVLKVLFTARDYLGNIVQIRKLVINGTEYTTTEPELDVGYYIVKSVLPEGYDQGYLIVNNRRVGRYELVVNSSQVLVHARVASFIEGLKVTSTASLLSFLKKLLKLNAGEVPYYFVEGYLRDLYGYPIPCQRVYINLTNLDTGQTFIVETETDVSGHFKTEPLPLSPYSSYNITAYYLGSDDFIPCEEAIVVKGEEAPAPSPPPALPYIPSYVWYILLAVIAIVLVVSVVKAVRKVVYEKKKYWVRL